MNLPIIDIRPTRDVPCGDCHDCCRGDAIYLHPECGDDATQYQTEHTGKRLMLAHKSNGDCIYLDDTKGCTIHNRRPTICREFDCRALLNSLGEKRMREIGLGKIAYAARRLKKRTMGGIQ